MKLARNSNIELLRIVSILLITVHHFFLYSEIMLQGITFNRLVAQFLLVGGKLGVNLFVLILGYYMCEAQKGYGERILKIVIKVWVYSIICLLVAAGLSGTSAITINKIIGSIAPISFNAYWFMTAYVGVLIFAPWINKLLNILDERSFKRLLLILFITQSFLPTFTGEETWSSNISWFITLYITAAYIRKYGICARVNKSYCVAAACLSIGVIWFSSIILAFAARYITALNRYVNYFAVSMESIFLYVATVALFVLVIKMKPSYSPTTNIIAGHVLGAYLLQSNMFLSKLLWSYVASITFCDSFWYIPFAFVISLIIVACGIIVDSQVSKTLARLYRTKPFTSASDLLNRVLETE